MKHTRRVVKIAKKYTKWGWRVVPVPPKKKGPRLKGWQKLRLDQSEIPEYFDARDNIGILLGKPSKGLVDIDLDCQPAIFLAPHFLPKTRRVHGRKSKPKSHYWFHVTPTPTPQKFCDVDGTCLVEVRSTGQQTIAPPSIHPSGERVRWYVKGRSGRVEEVELLSAVKRLAAETLIARHWPSRGSRNDAALALAGMLLQAGWDEAETRDFVSLVAQAADDEEWRARKTVVRTTRKRIDKGRKATGRPRLEKLLGARVVDRACEWLGIGRLAPSLAGVRSTEAGWPKSLSKRAYWGLAGDVVRAIGPITEADEAGLLVQFLISFGNAIGRNAHFRVGSAKQHTNLFGVLVGRTAKARKGTSWAEVERFFESADRVWRKRCLAPGGLASGEGLVWAVRDPIAKRVKPKDGKRQGQDITKIVDEGVEDKRLLVLETEFASPLRVIRRETNILSAIIRRAWDKGDLNNLTKQSPGRATGAHISIIGHITREELLSEFSAAEGHNGFANRFLWICVRRTQFLPLGGRLQEKTFRALVGRLQRALAFGRKTGELRLTKQAKKLWCRVYPKLGDEVPGLLGAITSRPEPQVLRLSVIYSLLDCSVFITKDHLRAGLAVWRYCEDSARYIFGDAFGDFVVDTILQRLRRSAKGLTRTDIREVFSRNRSETELSNALRVLEEHGLAQCVREETGGRPSERWFAGC
jgi:bifunctional DNA primase/polymerase-like protein